MNSTQVGDRVRICVNGTATAPAYLTAPRVVTWVNPHNCRTIRYGVANCFATSWVKLRTKAELWEGAVISAGVGLMNVVFSVPDAGLLHLARDGEGGNPPEETE